MSKKLVREGKLTRSEVDNISEEIGSFLDSSGTDKKSSLRTRLILEDMVLTICENMKENTAYKLETGSTFRRPFIRLSYKGEAFDPNVSADEMLESWSRRIMSDYGLAPVWQYKNGVNTLEMSLPKKRIGTITAILIALVLSLICGFVGNMVIPEAVRNNVGELVLQPLQSLFFSLLSVFAGIMILLSVACGIFSMGDTASFGKMGKLMFRRFIGSAFIVSTVVSLLCIPVFSVSISAGENGSFDISGVKEVLDLVYKIVPKDPFSPFIEGNTMQIVFIGILIGIAVLILGNKAKHLSNVMEETNSLTMTILSTVCRFLPLYLFFVLTNMIWSGKFRKLQDIWKPFLVLIVLTVILLSLKIVYTSVKYKVSPKTLVKKLLPSFMICITTASMIAAFDRTVSDCTQKFGISEKYVSVARPIAAVIYMPSLAAELAVMIYSMSAIYNIEISITHIILGIIICSVLTIAVPPLPGAVTMIFGILFTQMGIPMEAVVFAITCDMFFDFLSSATINSMTILEFVDQSDKLGMLDREKLSDNS